MVSLQGVLHATASFQRTSVLPAPLVEALVYAPDADRAYDAITSCLNSQFRHSNSSAGSVTFSRSELPAVGDRNTVWTLSVVAKAAVLSVHLHTAVVEKGNYLVLLFEPGFVSLSDASQFEDFVQRAVAKVPV